jgi:hypothetical protein
LNGREKIVEKNGPFSPTFCQIVGLMLPHRSVFTGLLLVAPAKAVAGVPERKKQQE